MVIARKANGNLRLCLDPKPLSKALKRWHFPMPLIEDILPDLGKAKIFTKVDFKDGYWQIKLTEESSLLTTFATPFGRYKWNRMPFGISPASEIFQLRLHEAVEGLDRVYAIADDILVAGAGDTMKDAVADHDLKIKKLLRQCQERNIKLNKQKVAFKQTEVPYIGHLLTSKGVKADPSKVEAVLRMERPTDVTGVQRIMGTVGYLAKFLPRLSEVSQALRQLTKKGIEFLWDKVHDRAFSRIKEMVIAPPLLKYYEREKDLVIQCDASEGGLGAALLQDGRPLAYASRALTAAERKYAQIKKELLAIVFSTERFHQYTYGRSVIVESDHKPLEAILAKPLVSAPKRLQRMILRLQRYGLDVRYKKGSELHLADTLSRHYPKLAEATQDPSEHVLFARSAFEAGLEVEQDLQEINHLLVSEHEAEMFGVETKNDEVLQAVKAIVQSGWPAEKRKLPATVAIYYDLRDELVIQDGLLFRGDRLVVPKALRARMLQTLHSSHQGIESTLRRARETIYWPNMKSDMKDFTLNCETCASHSTRQQKQTLISHDVPDRPWAKISTNLFDLDHKSYMVTVDYFSGFFEIDRLYDLKVSTVIRKLKAHMARYGIPDEVVSDSGSQDTSQEFKNFAKEYGFNHVTTSPYHHQSNGKAESAVKEAKKILKKGSASKSDSYLALLAHRNTPQEGFGTSPAQRLFVGNVLLSSCVTIGRGDLDQ